MHQNRPRRLKNDETILESTRLHIWRSKASQTSAVVGLRARVEEGDVSRTEPVGNAQNRTFCTCQAKVSPGQRRQADGRGRGQKPFSQVRAL